MPCDSADISLASTARADASCGDASTAQACGHTPPDSSACVQVGLDALRGAAERRKRVAEMQARALELLNAMSEEEAVAFADLLLRPRALQPLVIRFNVNSARGLFFLRRSWSLQRRTLVDSFFLAQPIGH